MAMLTATAPSSPSIAGSLSPSCTPLTDPSDLTTPRSNSVDLGALLTAYHKASTPTHAVQPQTPQRNSTAPGVAPRRPLCTHMTMKRIHGKVFCNMCGTSPAIGWVYGCTQHDELEQIMPVPMWRPIDLPPVEKTDDFFTTTARVAKSYGMHSYIVQGIRDRDYTPDQVHKLLVQKGNVFTTISDKPNTPAETTLTSHRPTNHLPTGSDRAPKTCDDDHRAPKDSPAPADADSPVKPSTNQKRTSSKLCGYQACPRCRPFYVDRIYMSFETVLSGQRTALTEEEMSQLPLLDPSIVKTMGLRGRPLPALPQDAQHAQAMCPLHIATTGDSDYASDLTPDSMTTSDSELDEQNNREAYPCPGGQHCLHWNPLYGCAYDNGFNDGLRAMNHGFGPEPDLTRMTPEHSTNSLRFAGESTTGTPGSAASTASSISLPTPRTPAIMITPTFEAGEDGKSFEEVLHHRLSRVGKAASVPGARLATIDEGHGDRFPSCTNKAASVSGVAVGAYDDVFGHPLRSKPSTSTVGSEVSVKGGVALTEEAVVHASPNVVDESKND